MCEKPYLGVALSMIHRPKSRGGCLDVTTSCEVLLTLNHPCGPLRAKGIFEKLGWLSSGCSTLVSPPGIMAMSVLVLKRASFTESTWWTQKKSKMRWLLFRRRPPGIALHTFWIHTFSPVSSIYPFGWQWMTTPGGNFFSGIVFIFWRKPSALNVFHLEGT